MSGSQTPTPTAGRPTLRSLDPSTHATSPMSAPSLSRPSPLNSPFGAVKSSISRKKPLGLDISKSIPKPSARSATVLQGPDSAGSKEGMVWAEGDRLRDEIARLQLSSRSSSSSFASGPESPPSMSPVAATAPPPRPPRRQYTAPELQTTSSLDTPPASSSASTSSRRKHANGDKKKKKSERDDPDMVKDEDLEVLADLGSGNSGTVTKVWNKKRKAVMARKLILVDAKPSVRKQIVRELQIMNDCNSPCIVTFYGCFPVDVHVGICMEFMDLGSLDYIYRNAGAVPIEIVGKVAEAVLTGLVYLYDVHRIIHRDIKPSNILANTKGVIKICDFGVSGELINSIANTFVGTSTYMSPERIQGAQYTIKSDVWSLGISLVELATRRFPFTDPPTSDQEDNDVHEPEEQTMDPNATLPLASRPPEFGNDKKHRDDDIPPSGNAMSFSILDLLQHIVNEPAPRLSTNSRRQFPQCAEIFIDGCLDKDPNLRKSPQELLEYEWIKKSTVTPQQLQDWASDVAARLKANSKRREEEAKNNKH